MTGQAPLFRPYRAGDRAACLAILDANTPTFFDPNERADFEGFLDDIQGHYFVLERDGAVVGCGGCGITPGTKDAYTSWGLVHPDHHGKGLGKYLIEKRLEAIRIDGVAERVRVTTSQRTAAFFAKLGFAETRREKDHYGPGFDLVEMWLTL